VRVAQVIGTVTLNRALPSLRGGRLKMAVPLSLADLVGTGPCDADPIVVYDEMGAGVGDRIMVSEGAEAAQPFFPEVKPIDAYNAGIVDELTIQQPED